MDIKSLPLRVKELGDDTNGLKVGEFTAYAAVFGNKDSYGDVIVKGAFADTLAEWKSGPNPIPIYWAHQMASDPDFNIGLASAAVEDDHGLLVRGVLDIADNPKAASVHRLMKGGRVAQMSFAYDVLEAGMAKSDELGDYYELRRLKLHEVSVVPVGANQETEVLAVKSAVNGLGLKAGRVLSAKNLNGLKAARDAIDEVIAAQESDDEKTGATTAATSKAIPTVDALEAMFKIAAITP